MEERWCGVGILLAERIRRAGCPVSDFNGNTTRNPNELEAFSGTRCRIRTYLIKAQLTGD